MPDRTLPDPSRAFLQQMAAMKRSIKTMETRQKWSGKTRFIASGSVGADSQTAPDFDFVTNIAELAVPPGSWTVIARTFIQILNQVGNAHLTGRERIASQLMVADLETGVVTGEVDSYWSQISATPEPTHSSGALELAMTMFGAAEFEVPSKFIVRGLIYDTETVPAPYLWSARIMALPA